MPRLLLAVFLLAAGMARAQAEESLPADVLAKAPALFAEHCASCHGADRLGGMGPALLPENLGRLKREEALAVIAKGRMATQMPGFGDRLDAPSIAALATHIYTPLPDVPAWGMAEMAQSRVVHNTPESLPPKPAYQADPLNLFTVVEAGDHHITILDGDTFTPLARFPSRFSLHGGAKYSPDGRFMYVVSRDGWVSQYDLYALKPVAEIRAGINSRNIAISGDGRFLAVGNMLPHSVAILDARTLEPLKVISITGDKGQTSRVSAIYTAPPRKSFIAALKDIPEIWEIRYDEKAEPVYEGMVHSYEKGMVEALHVQSGLFSVRRIRLEDYLDDFFFTQDYSALIGAARNAKNGQVVHLGVGRKIADVALAGLPHLGSGISFVSRGRRLLATPNLKEAAISVIDLDSWKTVQTIKTLGPGFFLRSHENSPYLWADAFSSEHNDSVHVIDKESLEIVKTLTPEPGKTAAHVEFDRSGRHALLSIWDNEGAIVVYDSESLEEIKRIPLRKPVGKYNVYNKIHYEEGTSH